MFAWLEFRELGVRQATSAYRQNLPVHADVAVCRPSFTVWATPVIERSKARVDVDGSVDEPSNDDEEWVVEAAIPLAAIPFAKDGTVATAISRCDVTKDGVKRCGGWKGTIERR